MACAHSSIAKTSNKVGLLGAFLIIVGFVIGASIYVLPGELFHIAGPAMAASVLLAAAPAALSCITAAQVSAAFPVDAANIYMTKRVLSPFWAALTAWAFIGSSVAALPLISFGFADYMIALHGDLSEHRLEIALSVIAFFALINLFGAKSAAGAQTIMVLTLLAVIALFIATSTPQISFENFTPFAPHGVQGVFVAVVPAFFAFLGFSLIVEISGEVNSPQHTIPRALLMAFLLITVIYMMVIVTVAGVLPAEELLSTRSPLAVTAALSGPNWVAIVVSMSALLATATTINAIVLLASRDAAAFVRLIAAPTSDKTELEPSQRRLAVILIGVAGMGSCLASEFIGSHAVATVLAFLIAKSIICLAVMKLPTYMGDKFSNLEFHIRKPALVAVCWSMLAITGLFMALSAKGNAPAITALAIFMVLGAVLYSIGRMLPRRNAN